ncbi:hypothetical protein V474_07915 [Novosphingobium barchaimii LL02]|uniref:Uncharacterized protein n=1 Tax=Novosphingobium barchaimii LL02 TaxID=1114963 RepID=A0A0J7Y5I6_9SPHN|nr:hypothetical protein V474_07915 [Novosphingobium barchaimii LL02]
MTGLALLRAPFPPNQISKLPKETKNQIDARKANKNLMVWKCPECGGPHHKDAVHLDYVGHAALTDRLLDCDPQWNWEPVILPGLPNPGNGMWIRLTVCGVSRIGFGDAGTKQGGDAIKEVIGDAMRNAAMRFGAALDLWHKGDLHADEAEEGETAAQPTRQQQDQRDEPRIISQHQWAKITELLRATGAQAKPILDHYKVADLKDLNERQAMKAINQLEDKLAELAKADTNRAGQSGSRPAERGGAPSGEYGDIADTDIPF